MGRVAEGVVGVGVRHRAARVGQSPHAAQAVVDVVLRPAPVHPQPVGPIVVVGHQSIAAVALLHHRRIRLNRVHKLFNLIWTDFTRSISPQISTR